MKVTDEKFLKALKDKDLRMFGISMNPNRNDGKPYVTLVVEEKSKYGEKMDSVSIEMILEPNDVRITNYSDYRERKAIQNLSFFNFVFKGSHYNHINTILRKIKKGVDLSFKLIAYNSSDFLKERNMIAHQLYVVINDKDVYLLDHYVGLDDGFGPVNMYY